MCRQDLNKDLINVLERLCNIFIRYIEVPASPFYMEEKFRYLLLNSERQLHSSSNLKLSISQHTTSFFANFFTVQATLRCNSLHEVYHRASNRASLKRLIPYYYFDN